MKDKPGPLLGSLNAIRDLLDRLTIWLQARLVRLESLPSHWKSRPSRRRLPKLPRPLTTDWDGLNRYLKAYDQVALDDQRLILKTSGRLVLTRKRMIGAGLSLIRLLKRSGAGAYRFAADRLPKKESR